MRRILIIDDEFSIVELLSLFLSAEGYEVAIAYDGQEGLAQLEPSPPDLVLCDVMMPVLGGREVRKRMQSNERYKSIPVILMSAVPTVKAYEANSEIQISKPFDLDFLLETITRTLQVKP